MCEHGRQRYACKECGGASICVHARKRSQCVECGGVGICEHGAMRHRCKECGLGAPCVHGVERRNCETCGVSHQGAPRASTESNGTFASSAGARGCASTDWSGSETCERARGAKCEHGRRRYFCKECGGAGICVHGRQSRRARSAAAPASASTGGTGTTARSAVARASASTGSTGTTARSAGATRCSQLTGADREKVTFFSEWTDDVADVLTTPQ